MSDRTVRFLYRGIIVNFVVIAVGMFVLVVTR